MQSVIHNYRNQIYVLSTTCVVYAYMLLVLLYHKISFFANFFTSIAEIG